MLIISLNDPRHLRPFNERARDLRVLNKPLWLHQRDTLTPFTTRFMELAPGMQLPDTRETCLVYRDNLFFDDIYIREFIQKAQKINKPCRAAFTLKDPSFREHALPLSTSYTRQEEYYLADLWYYPQGTVAETAPEPLVIDLEGREIGYYHVPTYMASEQGDLVFQVPLKSFLAIDSWVHIFIADVVFGVFGRGARFEHKVNDSIGFKLQILAHALYEGRQILSCSALVKVGRNCTIDPTAVINGPATIGDNVTIGAGAVIDNSVIGNNVNISQGCQVLLSVVGDGGFLPFRASLFMTTLMENSMVAQNTCLQMSVIGRNTFVGAGSTFTDFNLLPKPLLAVDGDDKLSQANREVLGSCVGHNCRLGSGIIVMPGRMIESDVVLIASDQRQVVNKNITYDESDHHGLANANLHIRLYPRPGEDQVSSW